MLLTSTPNQPYWWSQCLVLFLPLSLWPSGFHPCQTWMWIVLSYLVLHQIQPQSSVHDGQWLPWEFGGFTGSGIALCAVLPALYPFTKAEIHPILWNHLMRSSSLRPGCLPWNSSEENVLLCHYVFLFSPLHSSNTEYFKQGQSLNQAMKYVTFAPLNYPFYLSLLCHSFISQWVSLIRSFHLLRKWQINGGMGKGHLEQCFSHFNVHVNRLETLVKCWIWYSRSGLRPEILHF